MTQTFLDQMENGVSRRTLNGMKAPNPRCFGVWGVIVIGKKVEAKKSNRVSAKCAITRKVLVLAKKFGSRNAISP
jgi:hypothetical protein